MTRYLIALAFLAIVGLASAAIAHAQSQTRAQTQAKAAVVRGAWQVSMQGQGHGPAVLQTLALQQTGATISGTLQAPQGAAVPVRGTIAGQNISFSVKRHTPDGDVTQDFAGTISGDSIKGTVTQGQFHVDWSAARSKAPTKQAAQVAH